MSHNTGGSMGRRLILPDDFQQYDFLSMMKNESHARNRIRLLAMHHLQSGKGLTAVSDIVKNGYTTVQSWLRRFRQAGFTGLFESPRSGAPKKVTPQAEQWLYDEIKALSESKTGGYITGQELQKLLLEQHTIKCSLKTVYNTLHRLGFSWITSRSMHPKGDPQIQQAYKKTSTHFSEP